jgi:hypothetical protein
MTSRKLITGADERSSLDMRSTVVAVLAAILEKLEVTPKYIIAKRGITSSGITT